MRILRHHFLCAGRSLNLEVKQHLCEGFSERIRSQGSDPSSIQNIVQQKIEATNSGNLEAGHFFRGGISFSRLDVMPEVFSDAVTCEVLLDDGQVCGVPSDHADVARVSFIT